MRVSAPGVLQRLDAVLACREALEQNVKPQIAVEAMTAALRLPA
jgi:DNA polymerase-3 subunit delta'